jgi:hypothetical protein
VGDNPLDRLCRLEAEHMDIAAGKRAIVREGEDGHRPGSGRAGDGGNIGTEQRPEDELGAFGQRPVDGSAGAACCGRVVAGDPDCGAASVGKGEVGGIEFLQPGGSTSSRAAATAVELQFAL